MCLAPLHCYICNGMECTPLWLSRKARRCISVVGCRFRRWRAGFERVVSGGFILGMRVGSNTVQENTLSMEVE
jgi:hypothetical protein